MLTTIILLSALLQAADKPADKVHCDSFVEFVQKNLDFEYAKYQAHKASKAKDKFMLQPMDSLQLGYFQHLEICTGQVKVAKKK